MIREMTLQDLEHALDWATDEGWNPGLDDAAAFLAADPAGFFVAERDGKPVAAISVVNHDDDFAFLGLYLCHPAYRGRGIGLALWTHALTHAGPRTIGLDGVAAQQANYAKSGFHPNGATLRLQGRIKAPAPKLRAATTTDFPAIAALDHLANGYQRPDFLTAWTSQTTTRQTVVTDSAEGITGFATARLCHRGCKIGPVIAPDVETALTLIHASAAVIGKDQVVLDIPEQNSELRARLAALGFVETFRTTRMYRGPAPKPGIGLQAIGTMELG